MKISLGFSLLLGIFIGTWSFLSLGTFFIFFLVSSIFLLLKFSLPQEDRIFVFRVIFIAFILRLAFAALYYSFYLNQGHPDILGPDGEVYSQRGWYISRLLLEQNPHLKPETGEYVFSDYNSIVEYYNLRLPPIGEYQIGIYSYFIGILYAVFNYTPLTIKLINSAFSVFTGILIYFIGREIFNSKIGKISMASLIFLPSVTIYSITALKDTLVIFLLTMIIWSTMKFQKRRNLLWLILALVACITIQGLRPAIRYSPFILILSTLLLSLRIGIFKKCFIIILAFMVFLSIPPLTKAIKIYFDPNIFFANHIGYVNTYGNNYKIFPDRCYYQSRLVGIGPIEVTWAFIKGTFHLLFEPLPYRVNSKVLFLGFPQNILLYVLTPFIIVGLFIGLRCRLYQMIPLAMYLIFFIPLIAISEGNVGTVFRHRDMLMPFFIILGIAGCYTIFRGKDAAIRK